MNKISNQFASMYASFGSQVTVLEGSSELISREDRDIADSVREVLEELNTNSFGDGKIFIKDIEGAVKIRTGETGNDAL